MPEAQASIFDETDDFMLPPRRDLLPWWIKFFSWFFIITCPLELIMTVMKYAGVDMSMFGMPLTDGITFKEVLQLASSTFTTIAAYGLLREKDWAIKIAILNALFGVAHTLYLTSDLRAAAYPEAGDGSDETIKTFVYWFFYAFGLALYSIYLVKLYKIRVDWRIRQPRGRSL